MENKNIKLTKAQKYQSLISVLVNNDVQSDLPVSELIEFLEHELELVTRKRTKAAAKKVEDTMKDAILALLSTEPQPCNYFVSALTEQGFEDVSAAKVTARLSALVREEVAIKQPMKSGKSTLQHYSLA